MCRDVSTVDADQYNVDVTRDTDDAENVDVLSLDNVLNTANLSDMKVGELVDEQQADETLSGAFSFAKPVSYTHLTLPTKRIV